MLRKIKNSFYIIAQKRIKFAQEIVFLESQPLKNKLCEAEASDKGRARKFSITKCFSEPRVSSNRSGCLRDSFGLDERLKQDI